MNLDVISAHCEQLIALIRLRQQLPNAPAVLDEIVDALNNMLCVAYHTATRRDNTELFSKIAEFKFKGFVNPTNKVSAVSNLCRTQCRILQAMAEGTISTDLLYALNHYFYMLAWIDEHATDQASK